MNNTTEYLGVDITAEKVERVAVVILLVALCIVGVAGNAVVLVVYSRRGDRLASTVFIVVLAAVDFSTCLVVVPFTVYMELVRFDVGIDFVCKSYQFLITCNIPFSAMIMVAIAVDRYLSICRPLTSALNSGRAWLVTAVLGVFSAAIGLCVALMYSVTHYAIRDDRQKQFLSNNSTSIPTSTERQTCDDVIDCPTASIQNRTMLPRTIEVDRGLCYPTEELFSAEFVWYFQKAYNGLFLACLVTVVVLYGLIYRFVLLRRSTRQRQKSMSVSLLASYSQRYVVRSPAAAASVQTGVAELMTGCEVALTATASDAVMKAIRERKQNRVANMKTAAMLFVVTVVFVITFLPAFLMTVQLLSYSMIVFYMYFANNVANPIIYSFMNQSFRGQLRHVICRHRGPQVV